MEVLDQCVSDIEADVMLVRGRFAVTRSSLVPGQRAALPRKLRPAVAVRRGSLLGTLKPVDPVAEQRPRGVRVGQQ